MHSLKPFFDKRFLFGANIIAPEVIFDFERQDFRLDCQIRSICVGRTFWRIFYFPGKTKKIRFLRKFSSFFGTKFGHYPGNISARFYRKVSPFSNWEKEMCFWKQFNSVFLLVFRAKVFTTAREIFQQGSQKWSLLVRRILLENLLWNETQNVPIEFGILSKRISSLWKKNWQDCQIYVSEREVWDRMLFFVRKVIKWCFLVSGWNFFQKLLKLFQQFCHNRILRFQRKVVKKDV